MKHFLLSAWALLIIHGTFAQKPFSDELKKRIEARLQTVEGEFAVAFKDLRSGKVLYINEKTSFHAASTMKTPVMMEVFKQAKAGKFKLSDSLVVKNEFKSIIDGSLYSLDISDDSADDMYKKIGKKMTIYDLTYQMMIVSSNLATNILIDLVGAENANATMRSLGAKDMQVLRGVEDNKAYRAGKNNTVTAFDLALMFEQIGRNRFLGKKACQEMMKILLDQKFNDLIPMKLPKNVKVAHKTGLITGVHHDSGIVILPDGRQYVLVLLSRKLTNLDAGNAALADVSLMIYEEMMKNK
jgi:beta-lactamase class A